MARDYYIQPQAPDPVLDEATVLGVVRKHAPSARDVRGVDESGGEARAYAIDDDLILKVQRPQQLRPRTSLAKERLLLTQLAGIGDISVPQVLGGGIEAPNIEYTLLTRMPGVAIQVADLRAAPRRRALVDLGRMLRRIHGVAQQPLFASRLIPGDHTPAEVRWRMGGLFEDALEAMTQAAVAWPLRMTAVETAQAAMRALPDVNLYVALHSNPGPEHVFVHPSDGRLSGIIDFGDAYFSHPALDLRRYPCPDDRAAIFTGYTAEAPVSDEFEQVWSITCALADMLAIARNPECRDAARAELKTLTHQFTTRR